MSRTAGHILELHAAGPGNPDGFRAASVLQAYFTAEQARAFRRLLWHRLAICAAVMWILEAETPLLPRAGLVIVLLICAGVAVAARIGERRAERTLHDLVREPDAYTLTLVTTASSRK